MSGILRLPRGAFLAALLLSAVLAACGRPAAPRRLLAVVVDLSGPGREEGLQIRNAARLALREERSAAEDLGPVELLIQDDRGDPARAARLARNLFELPEIVAVIGPSDLSVARSAVPEYDRGRRGVPTLLPALMAPELTQGRSWVFSMTPAARYVGETLAWFLVTELAADSAASFFSADPFGQALDQGFFTEFERLGGAALNRVPFDSSLSRLDLFVGEARAAPALLVAGRPELAARMIEALRVAGVAAPILLGAEPLPPDPRPARPQPGPAEPGAAGADSNGAAPQEGGGSDVYYPILFDPGGRLVAEAFVERFTRSFGEPPHPSAALAYDAASLVLRGLEAGAADRTSLREWLEGMGASAPYAGVTGDFFFSQDHDVVRDVSIAARRAGGPVVTRRVASDPP